MSLLNEIISLADQSTDMWDKARLGKFTASEIHRLMTDGTREMTAKELELMKLANPKSKAKNIADVNLLSAGAQTYCLEKVAEHITGVSADQFSTIAMSHGTENEPIAREKFEKIMGLKVKQVGFVVYNDYAGGSPDGEFYTTDEVKDGIIEIKCPYNSAIHIQHLLIKDQADFKENHKDHYWQMQSNMLFTGTQKGWFISFDPRAKDHALFMMLIKADPSDQQLIKTKLKVANDYKNEILKKINSKKQK